MTVRFLNSTPARDIKPSDKIECFGEWYWVRYINYHGSSLTLRLQPEDEPLSENIRIVVTVPGDLMIDVEAR
ncbi:hypothetical protein vBKpnSCarvaje_0091 [Klebsiella phage vB_KpnS-Carvaje]|uniref:Uncharacterized protein n=1 Tax=Klebsiella phage vB_KpnS-Carvaje TaxID=2900314 RepID=A0AAE8ZEI8_9CAUD|nr:hypothetical protein PQD67_gp050 [Klebsiella phage vB_KpnS-Carvaje]UJQ44055.1 hypothetical protein vBKpnSCarvaje_0091 [Klebsiella phage vB_KpnS-Carvaje]